MTVEQPDTSPHPASGDGAVSRARTAQGAWAQTALPTRLGVLRRFRHRLAESPDELLDAIGAHCGRKTADSLVMEIIPIADACRFLEREAAALLGPRRLNRRGRPTWLLGVDIEIERLPLGVILVLAPGNYPLFLPGVQILQALAAGNAVLAKPAPGCAAPLRALEQRLTDAGLPADLFQVLDEGIDAGRAAIADGVDKVTLTGSAATGRAVLAALADTLTPATVELSGNDPVFVLPGANLDLAAGALAYGLTLNGGATCIAPRRVYATADIAETLRESLAERLQHRPATPVYGGRTDRALALLDDVQSRGGRISGAPPDPGDSMMTPLILSDAPADSAIFREDIFAPILAIVGVEDMDEALRLNGRCPFVLGASIFGPESAARAFAGKLNAG
ncbi:MAG: aldehyde dehydrogenase family protein, partial [Pseudomonadota bacterium]